ncbi:MAG: hypothetical protein WC654_03480 [Patescibacteria group bacterium]
MSDSAYFRSDSERDLRDFFNDDGVYRVDDVIELTEVITGVQLLEDTVLSDVLPSIMLFLHKFLQDPIRTFNRDATTVLESLSTLTVILVARLASARPPLTLAKDTMCFFLEAAMRAAPDQPLQAGLRLWADMVNAYGGRNVYGQALRAIVYLVISLRDEPNRLALATHLPAMVTEAMRPVSDDPSELAALSGAEWESRRTRCASWVITWADFATRVGVPLSQGAMRLRFALYVERAMGRQGSKMFSQGDAFEITHRWLARNIDLITMQTFLNRYGEQRVRWLVDQETRVDGRFLRELSRMSAVFATQTDDGLNRLFNEWLQLQTMGTPREFTMRQFLELGGTLDAALEALSRPPPPRVITNVVELFPSSVPKRLRLVVRNVSSEEIEVSDLALDCHSQKLVRAVCAEIWRIGYPGHFEPARPTSEERLERICVPKCRVTREQFVRIVALLLAEGAIRRHGTELFPGPTRHVTELGLTLATRAEALKRSSLVPS